MEDTFTSFHSWLSPSTSSQVCTQVPLAVPFAITSSTLPQALLKSLTPPSVSTEVQTWASVLAGSACSTTRPFSRPVACRALPLLRLTIINSAVFLPAICETSFLYASCFLYRIYFSRTRLHYILFRSFCQIPTRRRKPGFFPIYSGFPCAFWQ